MAKAKKFSPKKKGHAPKKDLDYLNSFTEERLKDRGIHSSESLINKIKNTAGAPMLPGLREYLPQPMVINLGRRALLDFGREWELLMKQNTFAGNKLDEFFKFVVERLNSENYAVQKVVSEQAENINKAIASGGGGEKTVGQWLRPLDYKDMISALSMFMVDSFAVAIATRSASETVEFFDWFLNWTNQLLMYWPADLRTHGANIYTGNERMGKIQRKG